VTIQPERPVRFPRGAGRRTRKGQAVVVVNELATTTHRRLHALRVLAAIFGRWNLHGIGPGAALLQYRAPLWERRPRRDWGGGSATAIGPGAALLQHRAPLWERRPRRDWGGGSATAIGLQYRAPRGSGALAAIGAAEAPRRSGRGRPSYTSLFRMEHRLRCQWALASRASRIRRASGSPAA